MLRTFVALFLMSGAMLRLNSNPVMAATTSTVLALSGQAAPGAPPDHVFFHVFGPQFDNAGNVLFQGSVRHTDFNPPGRIGPQGWWQIASDEEEVNLISFVNSPIVDANGEEVWLRGTHDHVFAGNRLLTMQYGLTPYPEFFLWAGDHETRQIVTSTRTLPDEYSNGRIGFGSFEMNADGIVAFALRHGEWDWASDPTEIWLGPPGALNLVAASGMAASDLPDGIVYGTRGFEAGRYSHLNDNGQLSFWMYLEGEGVDESNDTGIWFHENGESHLLARAGDVIEVRPGQFKELINPVIGGMGRDGQVAFSTHRVADEDVVADSLWLGIPNDLNLVAIAGEAIDASDNNTAVVSEIYWHTPTNSEGQLGFTAILTNGEREIWFGTPDDLSRIVSTNDSVDGQTITSLLTIAINDTGELRFTGRTEAGLGQWIVGRDGHIEQLTVKGAEFQVGPNDVRVIESFHFGNQNITDDGQLVAGLTFTDGTSAIVKWQIVPEPSTNRTTTLCFILACLYTRRITAVGLPRSRPSL